MSYPAKQGLFLRGQAVISGGFIVSVLRRYASLVEHVAALRRLLGVAVYLELQPAILAMMHGPRGGPQRRALRANCGRRVGRAEQ